MPRTIVEESAWPTEPGIVFVIPIVLWTAKKKVSILKTTSTKAKGMDKVVVRPPKKKPISLVKPKGIIVGAQACLCSL